MSTELEVRIKYEKIAEALAEEQWPYYDGINEEEHKVIRIKRYAYALGYVNKAISKWKKRMEVQEHPSTPPSISAEGVLKAFMKWCETNADYLYNNNWTTIHTGSTMIMHSELFQYWRTNYQGDVVNPDTPSMQEYSQSKTTAVENLPTVEECVDVAKSVFPYSLSGISDKDLKGIIEYCQTPKPTQQ